MPELPEVEVVRAGLEPAVTGATVTSVTVFDERSLKRHAGPSEDFIDRLTGRVLGVPQRRGKFLWIPLDDTPLPLVVAKTQEIDPVQGEFVRDHHVSARNSLVFDPRAEALVAHLGMSGQVLLRDRQTDDRLTRIRFELDHPDHGELRLNFVDQRIFGSMAIDQLAATADRPDQWIPSQVAHIARDPLDPHFSDAAFLSALARRGSGIKRALLDQSLISGIGNIYADESLWAARIHFDQPASSLSRVRARFLLAEVRLVLERALAEGGTSFDAQYVNVNGASGYFSHSLRAYGQQGKPCPRCGGLVVRESFMNRGSHFCPRCQRLPL